MQFLGKLVFVILLYYAITSAVSYFRKKKLEEEAKDKNPTNGQKPPD